MYHKSVSGVPVTRSSRYSLIPIMQHHQANQSFGEIREVGGLRTRGHVVQSKTDTPLITVITVVLNNKLHIEHAILSVIAQTYDNIEFIIIDGGSTDGTLEIIRKFEDRIHLWVSERDGGIYEAMNKGLKLASGDYVGMLNSDDWLEPHALQLIIKTFTPRIDFVYGDIHVTDRQGNILGIKSAEIPIEASLPYRMPFAHQGFYARRTVIEQAGGYKLEYRLSADLELICRLVSLGFKGTYIRSVIANFRQGGASGGIRTFLETRRIATGYGMGLLESWVRFTVSIIKTELVKRLPPSLTRTIRRMTKSTFSYKAQPKKCL